MAQERNWPPHIALANPALDVVISFNELYHLLSGVYMMGKILLALLQTIAGVPTWQVAKQAK